MGRVTDEPSPPPARGQQCVYLFWGKRFGKEVALTIFAAKRPQNDEVFSRFDTFGDDLPPQLVGQRNDGFYDCKCIVLRPSRRTND